MTIQKKMDTGEKKTMTIEKRTEKALKVEYQKALDAVREELAKAEAKYGPLSMPVMSKSNRLKKLEKTLNDHLNEINKQVLKITDDHSVNVYRENYYNAGYALETELQEKLSFNLINKDTIRNSVENPLNKLAIDNNADAVKRKIRSSITQGLAQGKSVKDMSKMVKKDLQTNANNATRIVRTETTRVQSLAIQQAGEKAANKGLELVKEWVATLDDRTRDRHRELDGVTIGINEEFKIDGFSAQRPADFGAAEMDINCRCRLIYKPKEGTEAEYRRARGTNGKNAVIPYKTFNDWFDNRVKESN